MAEDRTCVAWGLLAPSSSDHLDCPVAIVRHGETVPVVCMCDCLTCKRAWEADGRPIVRDGKVVRRGR